MSPAFARLLLLLCAFAGGPGCRASLAVAGGRSPDPLGALASGRLSDRITDPMVSIRHQRGRSPYLRPVAVVYRLDGLLLFARRLDRTRPPEPEMAVFEGRLRPGSHRLDLDVELEHFADERLTGEALGRSRLRAQRSLVLGEGQFAAITVGLHESAPGVAEADIDIAYRAVVGD